MACAAFAGATAAHAQVSGSVAVVSDYRFRGVSLSDRRPAAQLNLSYDHASGAYAGIFVSSVRFGAEAGSGAQMLVHAGYAARLGGGLSWDVGVAHADFSNPRGYAYVLYHAGVSATDWSARISRAPRYFGGPYAAVYAELDVTPWSGRDLAPLIHVGLQHASAPAYVGAPRSRWDARVGLAYNRGLLTVQLSWGTTSHAAGPPAGGRDKSAWVLRLTRWL